MTGKDVIKKLLSAGFVLDRVNGSHHILVKPGQFSVSVPVHGNRDLGVGLLKALERRTGVKLRV